MPLVFQYENNAAGSLLAAITAVSTSCTLQSGQGGNFPSADGTATKFNVTLIKSTGEREICVCKRTAGSDVLTFIDVSTGAASVNGRAQEGTSALVFAANDQIELRLTKGQVESFEEDIDALQTTVSAINADYLNSDHNPGGADEDDHDTRYYQQSQLWTQTELAAAGGGAPIDAEHLTGKNAIAHSEITDDEDTKHRLIDDSQQVATSMTVDGFTFGTGVVEFSGTPDLSGVTTDMQLMEYTDSNGYPNGSRYDISAVDDGADTITIDSPPATMPNGTVCRVVDPEVTHSGARVQQIRREKAAWDHAHGFGNNAIYIEPAPQDNWVGNTSPSGALTEFFVAKFVVPIYLHSTHTKMRYNILASAYNSRDVEWYFKLYDMPATGTQYGTVRYTQGTQTLSYNNSNRQIKSANLNITPVNTGWKQISLWMRTTDATPGQGGLHGCNLAFYIP